jgi:hypothetical protein
MAGERLKVLPSRLVSWGDWRAAHSGTTLMLGRQADAWQDRYERAPYERAFATGQTVYPVEPMPPDAPETGLDPFAVIAAFKPEQGDNSERADGGGTRWLVTGDDERVPPDRPTAYARWFAWYAQHPQQNRVIDAGGAAPAP